MNLCKTVWVFGVENYDLIHNLFFFLTYFIKVIDQKNEIDSSARFWPIFDFEMKIGLSRDYYT